MDANLGRILAGIFLFAMLQTMVMILVPLRAASMAVSETSIGIIVALPGLVSLLLDLPSAKISDKIGRRGLLIAGSGLSVAAAVAFALVQGYFWLAGATFAFGLASSLFFGPALAYVTEASRPEDHARVQGYNGSLQGLGAFVGAFLAGVLVDAAGFPVSFATVAIVGGLAAFVVFGIKETLPDPGGRLSLAEVLQGYLDAAKLLVDRVHIQAAVLIALIYGVVFFSVGNSFLPLYATTRVGLSTTLAGSLLATRNLLSTGSSLLFGMATSQFGFFPVILLSQAAEALALFLIPWANDLPALFALLAAQGVGLGFCPAGANIMVTAGTARHERALGFASVGLVSRTSMLVLPPLLGLLAEYGDMHLIFLAGGSLAGLCVAVLAMLILRRRDELRGALPGEGQA